MIKRLAGLALLAGIAVSTVAVDSHAGGALVMMPMTATPRFGDNACFVDDGGSYKNNCSTTQTISFMTTAFASAGGSSPSARVFSRDSNSVLGITCQAVEMAYDETSWTVGPVRGWTSGSPGFVDMSGDVFFSSGSFSIDCWVPATFHLGAAKVSWL